MNPEGPDYAEVLRVAVAAVRRAGARIRAEMSRPGGPRATGVAKAPIDMEVEHLLHRELTAFAPGWGWESEEDPSLAREGEHRWVVDPNDGTLYFLQGHRGASISVALLRGGEPVVAVVYAYAAPTDEGDLFAWARGGAPTRNGRPLRRLDDGALAAGDVVMVSPAAERTPRGNMAMAAPARFVTAGSLAWRLARAAAGECAVATGMSRPRRHDYAAGAALLRAVGGELVDERGRRVDLAAPGVLRCFGGRQQASMQLAVREVDFGPTVPHEPLAAPLVGHRITDEGLLDRGLGCWLGQLVGDSLGSLVEFQSPAQIARSYPAGVRELADGGTFHTLAGQPTDDSEMALAMARSILAEGGYDPRSVAHAYLDWYESRPFDLGNTVGAALRAGAAARSLGEPFEPAMRAATSSASQANGALMRIAPLAIAGATGDAAELGEKARQDARLTHPHPACQDANVVFACTLAHAIANGTSPEATYDFAVALARSVGAHDVVTGALRDARTGPPEDFLTHMGWLRLALHNAFHQLLAAPSLEEALVDTVGRGGDTDTNACIAGALLGAVHGRQAIPWRWQRAVLSCRPLDGVPEVRRPRPRWLWPCDALVLAERLLLCARG